MRIRPIRTESDHRVAMERIEQLWDSPAGSADADELEALATLVHAYEEEHDPVPHPDPIEAILFRLEQKGLDRADLQRILGVGRGRVSEVLSRRRGLSLAMIRKLASALRIPAEILVQPTKRARPAQRMSKRAQR